MFDPNDFLVLSTQLTSGTPGESACRTAIGRAYYACFLTARDQLFGYDGVYLTNSRGKKLRRQWRAVGGTHELIVAAVAHALPSQPGRAKILSDQLAQLRSLRVQADYKRDPIDTGTQALLRQYNVSDWRGLAHQATQLAGALIGRLKALPALPP